MRQVAVWHSVVAGVLFVTASAAAERSEVSGHFTDEHLATIKSMTLPRTFLYDAKNSLVHQEVWPSALAKLKANVGDAYCCVSDDSNPPDEKGPPKNCTKKVYGEDIAENFSGLVDGADKPISLSAVPRRKWLLVEYFADWCAPCLAERKALTAFFNTSASKDFVWLSIDLSRLVEVQERSGPAKK